MLDQIFNPQQGLLYDLKKSVDDRKNPAVFFCADNNRAHIATIINRPFIYVVTDWVEGNRVKKLLDQYGDGAYEILPDREDVLIPRKTCNYELLSQRLSVLRKFYQGKLNGIIVTIEGLIQLYLNPKIYFSSIIHIAIHEEISLEDLSNKLIQAGYKRVSEVTERCEFLIQGDRLDIFPIDESKPLTVEFFGDEVDSIKEYNIESRVAIRNIDSFDVNPATEILISQNKVNGITKDINEEKRNKGAELGQVVDSIVESCILNPSSPLNTWVIPFIRESYTSIYSYMPKDGVLIIDDVKVLDGKLEMYTKAFRNRATELIKGGKAYSKILDLILTQEEVKNVESRILGFGRITSKIDFYKPGVLIPIKTSPLPPFHSDISTFWTYLNSAILLGNKIRIYCDSENSMNALAASLKEYVGPPAIGFENQNAQLAIGIGNVQKGFAYPSENLVCIGINDIAKKTTYSTPSAISKRVTEPPKKGDYVVHERYGIGISEGIETMNFNGKEEDYYVIMFKGGEKLYVPTERLDLIEKYTGDSTPKLSNMGNGEFERVKQKVRESVKEMAINLMNLYKTREQRSGFKYEPDTVWQKEFEDDFEYKETPDQEKAIQEIKTEMEQGKIIDRLICGDVGFGKTEVALRAIFKTIIQGKQAAVLAPTTILAQQHYNLIQSRMQKFGIQVELLCRFVSANEIKESITRIKEGRSSVIVGTHRLLSKDIEFHDLGLLVLDEEQRFGVEQKEKIKQYRETVNVLSLSATPIPRTLHMSLSGIRDISLLTTPPTNRLPIETYVTEYSDELLKTAVEKEISRNGQVFILFNQVQGIEEFATRVKSILGDKIKVVVGHGQMTETKLEKVIKEFYDGKADVLISTTIIENGIDLPKANTLFVLDADKLGLSQLYQIRGRVGRSSTLAYAYFTIRPGKVITKNALDRLDALMSNTELGSGFKIAMRDLEIRGAGNVLGREQHGQMEKVGYDMYLRLVKEGIEEAQGKRIASTKEPTLKIGGEKLIPKTYIQDPLARTAVYKDISELDTLVGGADYYKKLEEIYGRSEEMKQVIRVALIRSLAKRLNIDTIIIDNSGTAIVLTDNVLLSSVRLYQALEAYKETSVLIPSKQSQIVFKTKGLKLYERTTMVLKFLSIICSAYE